MEIKKYETYMIWTIMEYITCAPNWENPTHISSHEGTQPYRPYQQSMGERPLYGCNATDRLISFLWLFENRLLSLIMTKATAVSQDCTFPLDPSVM